MSRFGRLDDPAASFILTGGRLVDPASGTDVVGDLAVVGGVLVPPSQAPADIPRIAADGLIVAPGLCDLRAHLAPDLDDAAALAVVTRAAARGGYTTICLAPDEARALDEPASVGQLLALGSTSSARVRVSAALSTGGEQLVDLWALVDAGAASIGDDATRSAALTRSALLYLAPLGVPLVVRCDDPSLARGTLMRSGPTATRLGLPAWPASAEVTVVERDLALAEGADAWIHFSRISTSGSLDAIRRARSHGVHVTCDVTPHHLALTDAWLAGDRSFAWDAAADAFDAFAAVLDPAVAFDASCRTVPPLPSLTDARALLAAVASGEIDAIATDHRPVPPQHHDVELSAAAPGMVGLATALSLGLAAADAGAIELPAVLDALSRRPAQLVGEQRTLAVGARADLVVFDPNATWIVEREALASVHDNTPLLGRQLPGVVRLTVANGRITYQDAPTA